ncbi:MAG: hypothetical protein AB1689_08280 [Thermodesulfobacteriota bacterium]
MTASAVLAELRARGVRAYRRGDKVRLEPLEALTPELIERARAVRDELLAIVSDSLPEATVPTVADRLLEPGRCPDCGDRLPSVRMVELCRPCRLAIRPDASLGLEVDPCPACGERERWRVMHADGKAWHGAPWTCTVCDPPLPGVTVERAVGEEPPPRYPLAVQVDAIEPAAGPLRLNAWTTVVDVEKAINADLALLRIAVAHYSGVWDDHAELAAATAIGERIDELLERLAACGARVRVVALQ